MPQNEPMNEQLQGFVVEVEEQGHPASGEPSSRSELYRRIAITSRALLAAREKLAIMEQERVKEAQEGSRAIAARDSQIAALRAQLERAEKQMRNIGVALSDAMDSEDALLLGRAGDGKDSVQSSAPNAEEVAKLRANVATIKQLIEERDSLRVELEAALQLIREHHVGVNSLDLENAIRQLLQIAITEKDNSIEAIKQRDAARAGEARLREALSRLLEEHLHLYEQLADDDPEPEMSATLHQLAKDALSAAADSARRLEEQLIKAHSDAQAHMAAAVRDAEQRGYERGKAEENEAYEREVFRRIAEAKLEGEIAGLRRAAAKGRLGLDSWIVSEQILQGAMELERQLAARREKAGDSVSPNWFSAMTLAMAQEWARLLCGGR